MSLLASYRAVAAQARLDEATAASIVLAAEPRARAALRGLGLDDRVAVRAALVSPEANPGGSLVPAWPSRRPDGSVEIAFVADWGALLAAWRAVVLAGEPDLAPILAGALAAGERLWIGIANDVLQMDVPPAEPAAYGMVRHHAAMLAVATTWLGPDRVDAWLRLHRAAARPFLSTVGHDDLDGAIRAAEANLRDLLAEPRAHALALDVVRWLDDDRAAAEGFRAFVSAASLGVAALLATVPSGDIAGWTTRVLTAYRRSDFNQAEIAAIAASLAG